MRRIRRQLFKIFVVHRSERMMRGIPTVFFFVPFEHWKFDYPKKLQRLRIEQLVAFAVFLGNIQTKLSASLQHGVLGQSALLFSSPSSEYQQVIFGWLDALANLSERRGKIALQPFKIVEDAQPALLPEGFDLVSFLAAELPYLRNMYRDQRQAFCRKTGAWK